MPPSPCKSGQAGSEKEFAQMFRILGGVLACLGAACDQPHGDVGLVTNFAFERLDENSIRSLRDSTDIELVRGYHVLEWTGMFYLFQRNFDDEIIEYIDATTGEYGRMPGQIQYNSEGFFTYFDEWSAAREMRTFAVIFDDTRDEIRDVDCLGFDGKSIVVEQAGRKSFFTYSGADTTFASMECSVWPPQPPSVDDVNFGERQELRDAVIPAA